MCTCLAWNEMDANILAIGHDRHRSDSCITIWDIERGVPKETVNFFGLAEAANSLCWDHDHRVLIAGMSQKLIKLFDLRRKLIQLPHVNNQIKYSILSRDQRHLPVHTDESGAGARSSTQW